MHITIKHNEGKYPSFNVQLHSAEGKEEFLSIKQAKIVDGQKGPFISWPAQKDANGKWWPQVWGNEKFNATVLSLAQASLPKRSVKTTDDDSDVPF